MQGEWLSATYRLIGELLLHPDDRDVRRLNGLLRRFRQESLDELEPVREFLTHPGSSSKDEYVQTLELSPPCPLYLGAYLFDEPTTCRGVGVSGRNSYMLELVGVYRHFGFDLSGRELPDYLPALVDFLWISLERGDRDGIGLRRRLVEQYVHPGLKPLRAALAKYRSPYALLIEALERTVDQDIRLMGDAPAWRPPLPPPEAPGRRLPVLSAAGPTGARRAEVQP